MIEAAHIVSDGLVLVFEDGTITYFPTAMLRKLGSEQGCRDFVAEDPIADTGKSRISLINGSNLDF